MKYVYLDKIQATGDVKNLPQQELPLLCEDIRSFLIESVSATGGHLSSNLGVVELTVALHRALNLPQDKILFDVGHQCYTHKLLTGRRAGFAQLRQRDGISGFPAPQESECDTFIAGHGSTALSTAIGVARAKKIKGEPGKVVAIIGDGAFTGGMVYEGMNNVSTLNNLIVVLNDNKMSISKNVGQMANYLTKLRTDPKYFHAKARMETALEKIPAVGSDLVKVLQEGKKLIRRGIYHSTMFEEMGFQYIGPVDGHDVLELTRILTNLSEQYSPVFLHIVTRKGKGLKQAEENPGEFHSVSAFDLDHLTNPEMSPKDSFSTRFGTRLAELGADVPNLCAITAAMKYGTGLNFFYHNIPERFFDVGMAEEHAVTFAAGLASQGMLPVVAIYSTFFQRAYDQMIHDVNLMKLNVVFAVDRAGLVPADGETHQGIYDPGYFSQIGIPTYSPSNYAELEYWLEQLIKTMQGPRAIRYARGEEKPALAALGCTGNPYDFIRRTADACTVLVSYGAESEEILRAADLLEQQGVAADCCKLVQIFPLPEGLCEELSHYQTILFAEEAVTSGGIGQQLCTALHQTGWRGTFLLRGVDNTHLLHATVPQLREDQGLDAPALAELVIESRKVRVP
ncbi:MAG: 1-deoxy-D-xylulose-5-phosphate synthase [Gemmiger sp.]|uniref:1-deoxy-D-xylulose-5-phosphate synthase n=1 Tax=Gemmiger sp. TaxID=2049027 RepID=UPI002A82856A|nr:1-deoxy-D-xylulose-5-phosphate synthase [Gemmiger sp.]MDY4879332.1 1-deoxy-D-xylulose-5-phosphate synthase [Gemmiger sp.]